MDEDYDDDDLNASSVVKPTPLRTEQKMAEQKVMLCNELLHVLKSRRPSIKQLFGYLKTVHPSFNNSDPLR